MKRLVFASRSRALWARAVLAVALTASGLGCPPAPETTLIGLRPVASGFTSPVAAVTPPDGSGRLFIVDQIGVIREIDASGHLRTDLFLDIRDRVIPLSASYDERGLLGLAFDPNFVTNGRFYVFYTAPKQADIPVTYDSETHISAFLLDSANPDRGNPGSEQILLRFGKPQSNHNGGQLAFGPDGFLYISIGDGGGANDVGLGHTPLLGNAQDRNSLFGKILRIDVASGLPYNIPPDNPLVGTMNVRQEIWAYGLRNVWRFSFDLGGTHRLFAGDVGQNLFEEVDIINRGGNHGWNRLEGSHCFDPNNPGTPLAGCSMFGSVDGSRMVPPIIEYPHSGGAGGIEGLSVIGGFVYRGTAFSALAGDYIFGDWSKDSMAPAGTLFAASEGTTGEWTTRQLTIAGQPGEALGRYLLAFGQDAGGEVYVLTSANRGPTGTTGRVDRIIPPP